MDATKFLFYESMNIRFYISEELLVMHYILILANYWEKRSIICVQGSIWIHICKIPLPLYFFLSMFHIHT